MIRIALAVPLVAALAASAAAVDFDQPVDVSAALSEARAAAAKTEVKLPPPSYRPDGNAWQPGCQQITFTADEKSTTLGAALESYNMVSDCGYNGGNYGNGNYGNGKYYGGACSPHPGSLRRMGGAEVTIKGRKPLLPWESDTFRVCMEGSMVDMTPLDTAYDYAVVEAGTQDNGWEWVVEPGAKKATKADPDGIRASFVIGMDPDLAFIDQWPSAYAGETVEIKYAVKRDLAHWPDDTVAEGVISSPTKAQYVADLSGVKLSDGKLYVEYSFRRVGAVSKDGFSKTRRLPAQRVVR